MLDSQLFKVILKEVFSLLKKDIKMKSNIVKCALALFFSTVSVAGVSAQGSFDWPQWRGSQRDGICKETNLLPAWPKDGPTLAWKVTGLGGGYSTPSVANGKIFGMSYLADNENVWALDEKNGSKIWETKIASKGKVGYNEGSRCTPTVDGNNIFVVGVSGDVVCLESASGKIVWQKNFAKDFKGKMMSGWGFSESPLIDGDKIIVTPGADEAALVALDKKTGNTIWASKIDAGGGAGYASIVISEAAGVKQYITWLGKCIVGVDANNGKFLWRYSANANGTANIPTAIIKGDLVFCSTGYGKGTSLIRLVSNGMGGIDAKEVYYLKEQSKDIQNHHGGMVLIGEHIFFGTGHNNGNPCCLEMNTGKVAWLQEKHLGNGSAGVLFADGKIYFRNQDGTVNLVEATTKAHNLISSFKTPEPSGKPNWPHPVIANGRLLLRDQDKMFSYAIKAAQ